MSDAETPRDWIGEYARSHRHPANRSCHTAGIPMVAGASPLFLVAAHVPGFWPAPAVLFAAGWIFQLAGHCFEGKLPGTSAECFKMINRWRSPGKECVREMICCRPRTTA